VKNKCLLLALIFALIIFLPFIKANAEGEKIEIYTAEDMFKMTDDPSGDYILMNDIDMKDIEWTPVDFKGTFDGNGHALLNLDINETSSSTRVTYDGNYKTYDTYFAGLFGVLENACVKNLIIRGINVSVSKNEPCFIGTIAGFAEGSQIENCDIEGRARLDADSKMFGVGGIVGYGGNGYIKNTNADITLICIDHDAQNRDEQFMGGAYSAGYIDVDACMIKIDGYDSDHGYVHNGGLVGMYILYPLGTEYAGYINNTRVEGMITFFEDNTDRRAYCKDFMGEVMNWTYEYVGNSSDFTRNEINDYSKDLLPYYCDDSQLTSKEVNGSCEEFGYTLYTCEENGYEYKADFTLKEHTVGDWVTVKEASEEEEGMEKGICDLCQSEVYRKTPKKEPVKEEIIEIKEKEANDDNEAVSQDDPDKEKKKDNVNDEDKILGAVLIVGTLISVILLSAIVFVLTRGRKKRR